MISRSRHSPQGVSCVDNVQSSYRHTTWLRMAIVCLNVVMGLQHFVSISPAMTKWGFIVVGKKASIRVHVLPRSTGLGWCRDYCRGIEPYRGRMMTRGTRTTGAAPASSSLHRHRPHQPLQHLQLETQAVLTSKHSPFSQRHVCL